MKLSFFNEYSFPLLKKNVSHNITSSFVFAWHFHLPIAINFSNFFINAKKTPFYDNHVFIFHYSNYQQIQHLAHAGHEIATQSISQQQGLQDKGYEEWVGEMIGMREILRHFSNVSVNDVVGMRAPFLKPGRNTQYKVSKTSSLLLSSLSLSDICIPTRK